MSGRHLILTLLLTGLGFHLSSVVPGYAAEPNQAVPLYAEEADGVSSLWIQSGPIGWLTDRAPLADLVPVSGTLGFSHQIGMGRLAWRATIASRRMNGQDTTFIYLDFISVERVYGEGVFRPFGRLALGTGLDLEGARLSLGDDGYFNEANGASGGLGVTAGTGVDVRIGNRVFWRVETSLRAYGGAGRTSVLWDAQTGLGLDL